MNVKPKKYLGQHFLKDENIARKIIDAFGQTITNRERSFVLEVGFGTGVITKYLLDQYENFAAIDVDKESAGWMVSNYPGHIEKFILGDFLKTELTLFIKNPNQLLYLIGNLPYNISGPVFFKVLDNYPLIDGCVFMVQKEVADRVCSKPGSKTYGILSVLLQSYYETENLFTVQPGAFVPPPKVKSAVIRLKKKKEMPSVELQKWKMLIKTAFNQRRKQLSNSLVKLLQGKKLPEIFANQRPEQLSIKEFIQIYQYIYGES